MTWAVGWRNGDDGFLALGTDPALLAVYRVTGAIRDPYALHTTRLLFPSCLRWMPHAEPVLDLDEISEAARARLAGRIMMRSKLQGF